MIWEGLVQKGTACLAEELDAGGLAQGTLAAVVKSISPNAPTIQADGEFQVHALAEPLRAKRLQYRHHRVGAVHCIEV